MTIDQMDSLIMRRRNKNFGCWERVIKSIPFANVNGGDERMFFKFMVDVPITVKDNKEKITRIVGWAHPDLMHEIHNTEVPLFCDCTFRIVPKPFYQCMVLMAYLSRYDMYVPIFYVLLEDKYESTYHHALMNIVAAMDWKL
jgi:hypothetical protein